MFRHCNGTACWLEGVYVPNKHLLDPRTSVQRIQHSVELPSVALPTATVAVVFLAEIMSRMGVRPVSWLTDTLELGEVVAPVGKMWYCI